MNTWLAVAVASAGAVFGVIFGVLATALVYRPRAAAAQAEARRLAERLEEGDRANQNLKTENRDLEERLNEALTDSAVSATRFAAEKASLEERIRLLEQARQELSEAFTSAADAALRKNSASFLELARETLEKYQNLSKAEFEKKEKSVEHLLRPIQESLKRYDQGVQALEQTRREAYGSLKEQIRGLSASQEKLQRETSNLVQALRAPQVRGRWGEVQLRRVVELAGMVEQCDFTEQTTAPSGNGAEGRLRPDMVVRLPGGRSIVVDAKVSLHAYLEALEVNDLESRKEKLVRHAGQLRAHMQRLSAKEYWRQFEPAPEFVVMFIPGEVFFSAALEQDPRLIEYGADNRVILATPTTLISLLRSVAYGWREEKVARNARAISELGRDLYERLSVLNRHLGQLGKNLDGSVRAFNQTVASLESRVLVAARRFPELGAAPADDELTAPERIERSVIGY